MKKIEQPIKALKFAQESALKNHYKARFHLERALFFHVLFTQIKIKCMVFCMVDFFN